MRDCVFILVAAVPLTMTYAIFLAFYTLNGVVPWVTLGAGIIIHLCLALIFRKLVYAPLMDKFDTVLTPKDEEEGIVDRKVSICTRETVRIVLTVLSVLAGYLACAAAMCCGVLVLALYFSSVGE
jgi:hypothetical protein